MSIFVVKDNAGIPLDTYNNLIDELEAEDMAAKEGCETHIEYRGEASDAGWLGQDFLDFINSEAA